MWSWPGEESDLVPVPQQPLPREIFTNCTGIVSFGSGWALRDRGDPQGSRRGPGLGPLGPTASLGMFHSTGLRGNNSHFVIAENEGEGREVPSETWIGMLILPEPQFGLAGEVSPPRPTLLSAHSRCFGELWEGIWEGNRGFSVRRTFLKLCVCQGHHTRDISSRGTASSSPLVPALTHRSGTREKPSLSLNRCIKRASGY